MFIDRLSAAAVLLLVLYLPMVASADLQVQVVLSSESGDDCNTIEQAIRAVIHLEGGEIQFIDYERGLMLVRIDERSWPLVKRLTLDPLIIVQCVGWSPPCSTAPVLMYADVTGAGRDDFAMAVLAAGGQIFSEEPIPEGVRLRIGIPGHAISTVEGRPELLDLRLERRNTVPVPDPALYLGEGFRFRVTAEWETEDATGKAGPWPLTTDTGAFFFFRPDNIELTVKVLDGCALTGHYWVFAAGLTNVGVTLEVSTITGSASRIYTNPLGRTFETITDTLALPCE